MNKKLDALYFKENELEDMSLEAKNIERSLIKYKTFILKNNILIFKEKLNIKK
ncbi:hypothetical protein [Clostridium septicum]|uniref:Uncharacterized protein n=1 Tax=Clostridium septicum TaxID=1504 RepID=A0ABY5B6K8_CLOSE|nr:hypothetical protein [Clostridium septicum]UEC19919.1 hypothetical protein LK444_10905 [Clostridium septicum]USS02021.1 hypothetical protein NH397_06260 [Clostridium septicum]